MTDTTDRDTESIAITVNGEAVEARPGELLIDACERTGTYIPRFCYHPRMQPVGMCRMCLVEVDSGRGPALTPSCMVECTPDMVVDTESDVTKKAQDGVLEFLLINHPLDCPVCDKGGECPLQDQTMAYGPGESRFVEQKRHFEKPIPVNDLVYLDRERCILCDRCTRFADDVAGDPLIHFQGRGNQTEVNTFPDHPFASYFSGNTVQICPVGALTAKPYRFKARPWDLEEIESTVTVDSVGSRVVVQSSRNRVLRYLGVDSDAVNWGWLSDRERFSFEALDHEDRLTQPAVRDDGGLVEAGWPDALGRAAAAIEQAGSTRVAAIGGARLTNEAQYCWAKLLKGIVGTDDVDAQLGDGLPADLVLGLPRTTISEACAAGGTIVVLGADLKETLGTLYLRVRHAVVHDGATLVELTPRSTGLSRYAEASLHARPGEVGLLATALLDDTDTEVAGVAAEDIAAARAALGDGPVIVIVGRGSVAEDVAATVDAIAALAARPDTRFLPALSRGNVHGALDMGLAPGLLPGRTRLGSTPPGWATAPSAPGRDTAAILTAAAEGALDVLVLLGADPLADFPDRALAARAVERVDTVIAVDTLPNASVRAADVVLPAAAATETDGTFTNLEGRLSLLARKVTAPGTARADWIIAAELAARLGADLGIESLDDVWTELGSLPLYQGVDRARVAAEQREGIVVEGTIPFEAPEPVEAPALDGYALRLIATREMYDRGTTLAHCPSSAGLHRPPRVSLHPHDFERLGVEAGAEVVVTSPVTSLRLPVSVDAGVPRGAAAVVTHLADVDAHDLIDHDSTVVDVRVEAG